MDQNVLARICTRSNRIKKDIELKSAQAKFETPQRIGEYSVTCNRDLIRARARYLYGAETLINGKNVMMDLNQGFDVFMQKEEDREKTEKNFKLEAGERLDNFWKWIIMQAPKGSSIKKGEPNTDEVVIREKYVVVLSSVLEQISEKSLKLVYIGAVDAIKAEGEMVELSTRRKDKSNHFYKNLCCYLQFLLMGIRDLYLGYRTDDGIVAKVEHVCADSLREGYERHAKICVHLLANVLSTVRSMLKHDGEACIVRYVGSSFEVTIHPATLTDVDFFTNTKFREHFNLH